MKILTCLLSIVMLGGVSQVLAEIQSDKIEQLISQYEASLNKSDPHSIMTLYSKSPVFMPQHSKAQIGRPAVLAAYEHVFQKIDLDIKFTIYEIETNDKSAWARTSSVGRTTILANGMKINEGNNELFVFKKEDGDWKIHRYLFSTTTPRQ